MTPSEFRREFPIFEDQAYLASCSQGALSRAVRGAFEEYLASWDQAGNPWGRWSEQEERLRARFAGLINAKPEEVAVTFSASSALNAIVGSLDYSRRPHVVTTDLDFPTVGHVLAAQRPRGAQPVFVPAAGGRVPLEALEGHVDGRTAVVAVGHVSYLTGARTDLASVAELAHSHGALVVVDAYQSAGTEPLDVRALGVDVLVTGALKYLLGPPGVAFLYVREELARALDPLDTGWLAQEDPFAFDIRHLRPASSARRFQSGTPSVAGVYGACAALEQVERAGPAAVRRHVLDLAGRLLERADERELPVRTPRPEAERGPLVVLEVADADRVASSLAAEGILCSARSGGLRVAFHYYNTSGDVDRLVDALDRLG